MTTVTSRGQRILVADELGILRCIDKPGTSDWNALPVSAFEGKMDKEQGIQCIATCRGAWELPQESWFAVGRLSGDVGIFNVHSTAHTPQQSIVAEYKRDEKVLGIGGMAWLRRGSVLPTLLVGHKNGSVRLFDCDTDSSDPLWKAGSTYELPHSILCCSTSEDDKLLALGCEGCELSILDVETGEVTNKLKGGRPNPQTRLTDKPWVSCLAWLPGGNGRRVLTGTGYHKLRLYDVEAQKRPLFEVSWQDSRITALAPQPDGHSIWVSNAKGSIQVLDLRTQRMMGALKGQIGGSIRSMAMHPTEPLLCSAGLDRWLRVHDTSSRKLLMSVYLKSQLTACAWVPGRSDAQQGGAKASQLAEGSEPGEGKGVLKEGGAGEQNGRENGEIAWHGGSGKGGAGADVGVPQKKAKAKGGERAEGGAALLGRGVRPDGVSKRRALQAEAESDSDEDERAPSRRETHGKVKRKEVALYSDAGSDSDEESDEDASAPSRAGARKKPKRKRLVGGSEAVKRGQKKR